MHNNAQEPRPPSTPRQSPPSPLRSPPSAHAHDERLDPGTGTCDSAAAPVFLSTATDAVTDPPPPHSPPYRRVADAQMQDDKHGASTPLSPLRAPPI
ncbi:hypothetical protein B0H13DRAFT_2337783 [Mycena leptocephala]|nr:hypothetical protein B0H13DRAFT_2337783 [Mycena leptocephala]